MELDIHMRIEDDLFYPAVSEASSLVAIAHAEHRQVWDQLAVVREQNELASARGGVARRDAPPGHDGQGVVAPRQGHG